METRADILTYLSTALAENITEEISADDVRLAFEKILDSFVHQEDILKTKYDTALAGNDFNFDCSLGQTQSIDLQGMAADGSLTFSNQKEGMTYSLVIIQGSGLKNLTLPTGFWLNDSAFDFTTLADNELVLLTATYINTAWIFAIKKLVNV